MTERLDEERLEILRGWGAGLASDDRAELRAAGRAITVLIEEIDHLHVDLWSSLMEQRAEKVPAPAEETMPASFPASALRERLGRVPRTT